jgi:hypothetical protein
MFSLMWPCPIQGGRGRFQDSLDKPNTEDVMKTLSCLLGSMSVAFFMAGCLLFLQPNMAHAAQEAPCGNCTAQCTLLQQSDCTGKLNCQGNGTIQCTKKGGTCGCSVWNQPGGPGTGQCQCG